MPRIATLDLAQINKQIDNLDILQRQLHDIQQRLDNVEQQAAASDPFHAPQTTNNITFTWAGGSTSIAWNAAIIMDKNYQAQTTGAPAKSAAPGSKHSWQVAAGSLTLSASSYYWLAWDPVHQKMVASPNVNTLHSNPNLLVICQIYTGTAGQSGVVGGGGSTGGVDFSGARYKLF